MPHFGCVGTLMAHKSLSRKIQNASKRQKQKKLDKVTAALFKIRDEKLALLSHTIESLKDNPGADDIKAKADLCEKLATEINELLGWICPPREPMSFDRALNFAQGMRELGMPEVHVEWSFKAAKQKEKGRPPAMRQASIKALEIKQAEPNKSWMSIAIELCPCGKAKHDFHCRENLRQAVLYLKAFLTKHSVTF